MMRTSIGTVGGLFAAAFALSACQTTGLEETPVTAEMPVIEGPAEYPAGTVIYAVQNGEPFQQELIEKDGSLEVWRDVGGCTWTRDARYDRIFSPSVSWETCGGAGEIRIRSKDGNLWPMQVGQTVSYDAVGYTRGGEGGWVADYDCEVVDAVRIETAAGAFDTYKVECETPWRRMTSYVAPALKDTVYLYERPTRADSAVSPAIWQFLRAETPSSS